RWSSDVTGDRGVGADFTLSALPLGTHVITASVTDSGAATVSVTRTIQVRHLPPELSVQSPWYYSTVQAGTAVAFEGYADDQLDGDLTSSIVWESNLDGVLGTGTGFTRADLSIGMHLITARVTDSTNQTVVSEARYVIVQSDTNTAPFVSISAPETGTQIYLNDPLTMTATGYDNEEGLISGGIQWSSNLDGPLGTGASVTTSALRVGEHALRAQLTDSGGGRGVATVTVTVLPIPDNYPPTVTIESLGLGGFYTVDSTIPLVGSVADREEGALDESIVWSSNIDGELGRGAAIYVGGLTEGTHEITTP